MVSRLSRRYVVTYKDIRITMTIPNRVWNGILDGLSQSKQVACELVHHELKRMYPTRKFAVRFQDLTISLG